MPKPLSNPTRKVLSEVHGERLAQDEKWGEQNHPLYFPNVEMTSIEWYAKEAEKLKKMNDQTVTILNSLGVPKDRNCTWDTILREEVYEALSEVDRAKRRKELVQVAAVAVAMIEQMDREDAENEVE